jgi:methyl-accepting chemotaxis protein
MFTFIRNLRIFPRLFILFTVMAVIAVLSMVLLGSFYLQAEQTHAQAVKTSFEAQQIATTQQINLQRMNALLQARFAQIFASNNDLLHDDPSLAASGALIEKDIVAREIDFNQTLQNYNATYKIATSPNMSIIHNILASDDANAPLITSQQVALENVSNTQWNAYKQLQDQVLAQLHNPDLQYQPAYATLFQANLKFQTLQQSWQTVVGAATTVGQAVTALNNSEIMPVQIATVLAILLIIAVIGFTAALVNATISRPLRQLATLTTKIAQGDTSQRVHVEGRDEIQMVALSMNNMLNSIVQLIKEAEMRHTTLQMQVERLIGEVSGAGQGDLRVQATVSSDSLGVLASFFNYMVSELGVLVINFKTLANEVERATLQTYDDMAQLVDSADKQIEQITSATTNISEMANTSRVVAQRVQVLSQVGGRVYQTTQSGRNAVLRTVEGMGHINSDVHLSATKVQQLAEHSQEISDIVKIISGIAHQTNRLALDASIQAALAGENGKAFRAVADDIRRSAEVAKTQTNKIERIVKQLLEDIESVTLSIQDTETEAATGAQLSREAGAAFEAIVSAIEYQSREIEMINQAAQQQLQTSSSVAQVMRGVSSSTLQSSQSIREEAKRMERVAQLAEQLLVSAEVFKLRDDQDIFAQTNHEHIVTQQAFPQRSF